MAELIASIVGSWFFIVFQTFALVMWVVFNVEGILDWDPYPFILLNLVLSLQAAFATPMILMAQNRQSEIDRQMLRNIYEKFFNTPS